MRAARSSDISRLRYWGRHGVRMMSAELPILAVVHGNLQILHCLVRELGAHVNEAKDNRNRASLAALIGDKLAMVRLQVMGLRRCQ